VTGLGAFLRKELAEIVRTWRIWVLPGLLIFFGLTSPPIARLTPALLSSLAGPGLVIQVPEPTAAEAYAQFLKNLSQLVSLAIVIALAGAVSAETRGGTAILVLTKPVSRAGFIVAKAVSNAVLLALATIVGAALCLVMTQALFDGGDAAALAAGVAIWLAFGLVLVAAMVLVSAAVDSQAAASAVGLGIYFACGLAGLWAPLRDWTFVGLLPMASAAMAGESVQPGVPLAAAAGAFVGLVAAAVWVFSRREI
jgi:ABC-2 type transport system permease protein